MVIPSASYGFSYGIEGIRRLSCTLSVENGIDSDICNIGHLFRVPKLRHMHTST